jgi:internalin A
MRKLEYLTLGRCSTVRDAGLSYLTRLPNLQELDLHDTAVTNEGLKSLAAMHSLRRLRLSGSRATAAGIAGLKRKLPLCQID